MAWWRASRGSFVLGMWKPGRRAIWINLGFLFGHLNYMLGWVFHYQRPTIMSSFFTVLSVQPAHLFSNSDTLSLISSAFPKQRHSLCGGFYGCESVCPSSPLFIPCFFLIVGRWETKTLSSSPPSFPSLFSPPATHLPVLAVFSFFR